MSFDSHAHASVQVAQAHEGAVHEHPTWGIYKWIALILTVITAAEVWCYYLPPLVASPFFVPVLLVLSAAKFAIVVMFYMHIKYDHALYRGLFLGSLSVAIITIVALMFLFGKVALGGGASR